MKSINGASNRKKVRRATHRRWPFKTRRRSAEAIRYSQWSETLLPQGAAVVEGRRSQGTERREFETQSPKGGMRRPIRLRYPGKPRCEGDRLERHLGKLSATTIW